MNTVRYYIALLVLLAIPPSLLFWFFIHPFAGFWRRLGPVWTYTILSIPTACIILGVFLLRRWLLALEYGTQLPLVGLAVMLAIAGFAIQSKRRKHLTNAILTGIPELSRGGEPGKLLTEGIYGTIRHPRYIEIMLFTLAYACFSNYLAVYVATLLTIPTLYLVVLLEERELVQRFGADYVAYCSRVPRFLPRRTCRFRYRSQ